MLSIVTLYVGMSNIVLIIHRCADCVSCPSRQLLVVGVFHDQRSRLDESDDAIVCLVRGMIG